MYLSAHRYKTHRIALLEDISFSVCICRVFLLLLHRRLLFLASALRPKNLEWKESRSPSGDLPAPIGPTVL